MFRGDNYFSVSTLLRIVASLERVAVPHHFAKLLWLFQSGLLTAKEPQKTNALTKHRNLTSHRIKMSNNFVLFLKYFVTYTHTKALYTEALMHT